MPSYQRKKLDSRKAILQWGYGDLVEEGEDLYEESGYCGVYDLVASGELVDSKKCILNSNSNKLKVIQN